MLALATASSIAHYCPRRERRLILTLDWLS
ncbi:hypothetical protein J2W17_002695 [Pseudomonas lini]|nr:hypothetical protein [Pseudomonas lini]